MIDLSGKTILVVGATGTIGRAICRLLKDCGARILATGKTKDKLDKLSQELQGDIHTKSLDLLPAEEAANELDKWLKAENKLDGLIYNSAIALDEIGLKMSNEQFSQVIDLNLNCAFMVNKLALKKMLPKRQGKIVNMASSLATTGASGACNYSASKAGLIGMSKSLAKEMAAKGININILSPGAVESEMLQRLSETRRNEILTEIPMQRFGSKEEIAGAAIFLLSDLASYITGQTLHANGGYVMP